MYREPVLRQLVSFIYLRRDLPPREGQSRAEGHTLMAYLKNRPQHLVFLLALMRCILGVFHLVVEFEEGIFYVVEAGRRGFAGA